MDWNKIFENYVPNGHYYLFDLYVTDIYSKLIYLIVHEPVLNNEVIKNYLLENPNEINQVNENKDTSLMLVVSYSYKLNN